MIDTSEVNVYKITNLISNHSKEAIDAFNDYLNLDFIENDKLHQFNADGNDYTLTIRSADLFTENKLPLPYFIVFDGLFNDVDELRKNMNSILLSFPLFLVDIDSVPEQVKEQISLIKTIYVDESRNSIKNVSANPKFISSSKKVIPLLSIFEKKIKKDIVSFYEKEVSNAINNFVFMLNELKDAIIKSETSKGFEEFNDWDYAPIFFSVNNLDVWVKIRDAHTDIVVKDNDTYSIWYINNDYFDYDKFDLSISTIKDNPACFIEWLLKDHCSADIVLMFDKNGLHYSIYDKAIDKTIDSAFISFVNSILGFQKYCDYKIEHNVIKNADELFSYDLGYESYKNLIGWILFGRTSFVWLNGGLKDKCRVIPYSLLENELPMEFDNKFTCVAAQLSHSEGLIYSIPDDIHDSFKIHIKAGYDMLKNNEFPLVCVKNVNFEEIENRLIELKII